ncbi:hypothetical protein KIPB_009450, partial [Kipferlia bialata]
STDEAAQLVRTLIANSDKLPTSEPIARSISRRLCEHAIEVGSLDNVSVILGLRKDLTV